MRKLLLLIALVMLWAPALAGANTINVQAGYTVTQVSSNDYQITYTPYTPPVNTAAPTISGQTVVGQTLTASPGTWTNSPTFTYQWQSCSAGACANVAGATASTYKLQPSDVGNTFDVIVTATNSSDSASATSAQTAMVTAAPTGPNFVQGKAATSSTSPLTISYPAAVQSGDFLVGIFRTASGATPSVSDSLNGAWTKAPITDSWMSIWYVPVTKAGSPTITVTGAGTSGTVRASIAEYSGLTGTPAFDAGACKSNSANPSTTGATSAVVAGDLVFAGVGSSSNGVTVTAGSSNGVAATLRATTTSANGTVAAEDLISAAGAQNASFTLGGSVSDYGNDCVAAFKAGTTPPPPGYPPSGAAHYLYTAGEGTVNVFDIDNGFSQVATISLPQTAGHGIRGISASPSSHILYVSYGGDGGSQGNGSLLAYDLVTQKVLWTQSYSHGIDSFAVTPDGKTIYMPDGELSSNGLWHVINASTGADTGTTIDTGAGTGDNGPHNTIVSLDGSTVYMGDRNLASSGSNYFYEASTATNQITTKVGPFRSGIRPFTVNKEKTLVYASVTGYKGFQSGDLSTGKVLYTTPITTPSGTSCPNSGASDPSHGVSLSPDEKQLYVIDWPCNGVAVFDVSGMPTSPPTQTAWIPVRAYNLNQSPCTYDCLGDGWLLHSGSGSYVFVGDSGDVISTATEKVVANISPLYQTRVFAEIDWGGGAPSFTTTRHGLGYDPPTFYVSSVAHTCSPSCDGSSWANAWTDTSNIAWGSVPSDSTIVIDGGSSRCTISPYDFSGGSENPGVTCGQRYSPFMVQQNNVTIQRATETGRDGTVVIDGGRDTPLPECAQASYTDPGEQLYGIDLGGHYGLTIDGENRSGIIVRGAKNGIRMGPGWDNTLRDLELFDNGYKTTTSAGYINSDGNGIWMGGQNNVYDRLLVHDNGQDEFHSDSTGYDESGSTVENSWMGAMREHPVYQGEPFNDTQRSNSATNCTHADGLQIFAPTGHSMSALTVDHDVFGPGVNQGVDVNDGPSGGPYAQFYGVDITNTLFLDVASHNIIVPDDPNLPNYADANPVYGWYLDHDTLFATQGGSQIYPSGVNQITNTIKDGGYFDAKPSTSCSNPGTPCIWTNSGNDWWNGCTGCGDPLPGSGNSNVDPGFPSPPTGNLPSFPVLRAANLTPTISGGSPLHSWGDILTRIDSLNGGF